MEIQVELKHILSGKQFNTTRCPVALAVEEAGGTKVFVSRRAVFFELDGVFKDQVLPYKAIDFTFAFDKGMTVAPFTFTLY